MIVRFPCGCAVESGYESCAHVRADAERQRGAELARLNAEAAAREIAAAEAEKGRK